MDTFDPFANQNVQADYFDWWGDPMDANGQPSYQASDGSGYGSFGNNVLPYLMQSPAGMGIDQGFTKFSPMSFSEASSFLDKLSRPVKAPPQVNWDKLLDEQLTNYKRSMSDSNPDNTMGLDMYTDERSAGIVQGYVNDLQSGKITPEEALRNFNYRTGQTDRQGNPRIQTPVEQSNLQQDMLKNAKRDLDKAVPRQKLGQAQQAWLWADKNFRGVDPQVDKLLTDYQPKDGKYAKDEFKGKLYARIDELINAGTDTAGEKIKQYGVNPSASIPTYNEAVKQLRGLDPNLDKFFNENPNAAQVVANQQKLDAYNRLIADLTGPAGVARRRGLPAPDAPGDLEYFSKPSRAAMQEMLQKGGRAQTQLPRMPTPREQYMNLINMLATQLMFRKPRG